MNFLKPSLAEALLAGAAISLAAACSTAVAGNLKPLPDNVTFSEHVAPILFNNCTRCHRPGEAAPFALMSYDDAKKRARQIAEVTHKRFMPPWHAEPGFVEYSNERRLTDEQIALLTAWHQQGAKPGDLAKTPPLPKFPEGWQLGKPDLVLSMPEPFEIPAEGKDIYWNFVLPLNLTEDKWVRAVEFRPGARAVVHHALYYVDTSGDARKFDARDPKPGYNGMARSNRQFESLGGWAVGGEALALPPELAWHFTTNSDFVIQAHYHPSGKVEHDVSSIGIYFADKPPTRTFAMVQLPPHFGRLSGMNIPAGAKDYAVTDSFVTPIDLEAFLVTPHAHYLGKTFQLTATPPNGRTQTLLKIANWDFSWQEDCAFKDRIRLPKGTRLDAVITYDNSAENPNNPTIPPKKVKWGPTTLDEMAAITLSVIPAHDEDLAVLKKAKREHNTDLFIDRALEDKRPNERIELMKATFDKNHDGTIDRDERPALREFLEKNGMLKGIEGGF